MKYRDLLNSNPFNIYRGRISFGNQHECISFKGEVNFHTSPYPQIILSSCESITFHDNPNNSFNYSVFLPDKYIFSEESSEFYSSEKDPNKLTNFTCNLSNIKSKPTEVDEVIIFIMNCSHIGLTYFEHNIYKFDYEKWVISFNFRPDKQVKEHYEELRKNRSNEITHVGTITKKGKEKFNVNELDDLISSIEWYLSFCSGQSVFIPIQIGFKEAEKVWENFIINQHPKPYFRDTYGWVKIGNINNFNTNFSSFANKLNNELWEDIIKISLNWYLEIKSTKMIENGIISTQVALEQLAWTYLVNQECILEKEAYKKLRSSDILRLLCYQLSIPTKISRFYPSELVEHYNDDGVFMFVDCRNNLVHPDKKNNFYKADADTKFLVFSQGLYFLESALKRICCEDFEIEDDYLLFP